MQAPILTQTANDIAADLLLRPYDITEAVLQKTLSDLGHAGIDDADLYFQYTKSEAWGLEEGMVKSGSFSIDQGVGVRSVAGEKMALAYSDEINPKSLLRAASAVRSIAKQSASAVLPLQPPSPARALYLATDPCDSMDTADKIILLERLEKLARAADPRIVQVMASLAMEYDVVYIARLDGTRAADVRPLVRLSLNVIAEQNGKREQGSSGGGGRVDLSYFTAERLADYVQHATKQALMNLEAQAAPAGQMTVVLGSGWPGVLLHEAIGHGLEGDFNRKGTSAFAGKLGQRVAAKGVTIVDDGTLPNRRGSLTIDDEGTPTQCTTLIEDGILQGYLQDSLNARLMNTAKTGNARRESYAHLPMPRMTNTYMQNGQMPAEEIIASVKDGIYAINFGGGQVDITSGKFVFSASETWKIENGQLVYPIKGATLIGDGPNVLNYVSMIGNDLALDSGVGVCGKEGQSVPVGVGQPTLRIDGGLTVGGSKMS
jgi:TldD protein